MPLPFVLRHPLLYLPVAVLIRPFILWLPGGATLRGSSGEWHRRRRRDDGGAALLRGGGCGERSRRPWDAAGPDAGRRLAGGVRPGRRDASALSHGVVRRLARAILRHVRGDARVSRIPPHEGLQRRSAEGTGLAQGTFGSGHPSHLTITRQRRLLRTMFTDQKSSTRASAGPHFRFQPQAEYYRRRAEERNGEKEAHADTESLHPRVLPHGLPATQWC